jgi:Fur family transcriptional regulator, ferric uptake regulator
MDRTEYVKQDVLPQYVTPAKIEAQNHGRDLEELKLMIRRMNLKVTAPRILILQTIEKGNSHMTAQEVFERAQKQDATLGFATVYRFLRKMVESQIVTEVRMGGLPARYELTPLNHHDHLTCTHCGKIEEFENLEIENLQLIEARSRGFRLTHHVLELYGVCSDCQRREAQLESRKKA